MLDRVKLPIYDQIGTNYSKTRHTDPRIQNTIMKALGNCETILNVGAGSGSYEPRDRQVVSLDPSLVMLKQRTDLSYTVRGIAELLPFPDKSFDAAMGVSTIHHWSDKSHGIKELKRVVKDRVVIFTWDRKLISNSWLLCDYLPASKDFALKLSIAIEAYASMFEAPVEIIHVPIPWDCLDGFPEAYWRRPNEVLDPVVWKSVSILTLIPEYERTKGLNRLALELRNGQWRKKYGHLLKLEEYDMGIRLVVWRK